MESNIINPRTLNTTALAYLGDSVWELAVRDHLISLGHSHVDKLHKDAVKYVSAEGQAFALKLILEGQFLSDDEEALVKRARNHKLAASKKNSKKDAMTDKYATAFEALLGYLYLGESPERLDQVISAFFLLIESAEVSK